MKTFSLFTILVLPLLLPTPAHAFYNPSTGRWLSRDPIEEDGGLNIYVFVQNEPASRIDADGRCSCVITLHCVRGTVLMWTDGTTVIGPVTITRGRDIANYDCTITRQSGCCPFSLVGLPGGTQRRQVHWVQTFPPGKRVGPNLPPAYDTHKCLYLPIPDGV